MVDLAELIGALPGRPDLDALMRGFVPPARFAGTHFSNFAPLHPSQQVAVARLDALARSMQPRPARSGRWIAGLRHRLHRAGDGGANVDRSANGNGAGGKRRNGSGRRRGSRSTRGSGIYLDGGFGVGKTHLLAALWHAAPPPRAYLTFDELMYFIGLVGVEEAHRAFAGQRLAAVDEWELDDPGNLKLALAFLRGALSAGVHVVVTSNTLPIELGKGRFSQKDFLGEIDELAASFEVIRMEGDDYRQRRFEADPGRNHFLAPERLREEAASAGRVLLVSFDALLHDLGTVHPIRFAGLVSGIDGIYVERVEPIDRLADALRWVHFIDTVYDSALPFRASADMPLAALFRPSFLEGPYGRKLSRCLSRMEEMLGERAE